MHQPMKKKGGSPVKKHYNNQAVSLPDIKFSRPKPPPDRRHTRKRMEDLSNILTFEVKKEIADRYFGFRKIIEEDTRLYKQKIISLSLDLEKSIGFDLVRIYTLLQEEELIYGFFKISGLPERFFFDSYINKSPEARKRILSGRKIRGLTRWSCFKNMFFDTYTILHDYIIDYRAALCDLTEDHDTLREQINLFYRKNDLTGIMQFLRNLDRCSTGDTGSLDPGPESDFHCGLDEKMRLHPPDPVDELLPDIPEIPPLKEVRTALKDILLLSWSRQPGLNLRRM